jgi:hypothetical protein
MPYNPPIQLKKDTFGRDTYKDICEFIREKIAHLDRRLNTFRAHTLPEYARLYRGQPRNESIDWPWEGASNLTVQLIGTFSDELLARQMAGIWMYDPLWTANLAGDTPTKDGEEMKEIYQTLLQDQAYDPAELDLYRVEQGAFHSANKYGTGVIHFPWEYQKEVEYLYISGGLGDIGSEEDTTPTGRENEFVSRDGPHPEMVPLNRWGFDPNCPSLGNMKFFYHIDTLDYWDVKNLKGRSPYYKQEDIDELLLSPDARQDDEMEHVFTDAKKIDPGGISDGAARWYIHRCVFTYRHNEKNYCLFANYHKRSERVLYIVFNNYPKNLIPYEDCKLAYDEESYLGTGFAELLHVYQKELSNNVNWRTNNRNYAMLGAWRVSPESKLSSILDVFPGVAIPARQGELEYIKAGTDVGYNNAPDEFIQACAKERAGVDPAMGGTGGGVVNPKRGIYSAAGTSMILMQQNNRNSLRTSDMRSAHVKLGQKLGIMYATFGIGDRLRRYGTNADILKKALDAVAKGSLGLRLRPTSASLNKELERQNDILLSDRLQGYYQRQAQIIEAMMNPQCPPPMKDYFAQTLIASRVLMQALVRNFNKSNVDAYLPQVKQLLALAAQGAQPPAGPGQGAPSMGPPGAMGGMGGDQEGGGFNSIPGGFGGGMAGGTLPAGGGLPQ